MTFKLARASYNRRNTPTNASVANVNSPSADPNAMSKIATACTGARESLRNAHMPIPSKAEAGSPIVIITSAANARCIASPLTSGQLDRIFTTYPSAAINPNLNVSLCVSAPLRLCALALEF